MIHGDAAVLDAAHEHAQLVLALHVLHELRFHAEAPHLLEVVARQLHLVQRLGANLDQLVTRHLASATTNETPFKLGTATTRIATRRTYVRIDEIGAVRHKVVRVVHVAALFHAHKVLGRVETPLAASARQKLFHRHVLLQVDRGRLSELKAKELRKH